MTTNHLGISDTSFSLSLSDCYVRWIILFVTTHCLFSVILSSRSLWSITSSLSLPGHDVCTPYIQFSILLSHTHTYHFLYSWTRIYYLQHKFHVLINCIHMVYVPWSQTRTLHFGFTTENFGYVRQAYCSMYIAAAWILIVFRVLQ